MTAFNITSYGMLCCREVWYIYTDFSEQVVKIVYGRCQLNEIYKYGALVECY